MPIAQVSTDRAVSHGFAVRRFWRLPLLLCGIAAGSPAYADDDLLTWIVQSVSADYKNGAVIKASTMQVPQAGTILVQGQQISTEAGTYMVLTNGRDLVA